ncbi:hypothetical protein F5Y09DRAFT_330747 [Xylaria sp. FL1042]|nr:hypothetical protein F5Y09DRAFT_330747 [Xylaria sp. FL1042]
MPPGVETDLLLLGCGDVRNILFTCHINARNILLLSLIIDREDDRNDNLLWDIYYHIYLSDRALDLLCSQAKKLYALSITLETWHQGEYQGNLSFCDSNTLLTVRSMWRFYSMEKEGTDLRPLLQSALERAKSERGNLDYLTGFRSTIPAQNKLIKSLDTLHRYYWRYGTTEHKAQARAAATFPNPTFLVEDGATIHYCTNPLFGFHLVAAYAPIRQDDAAFGKLNEIHQLLRPVEAARTEFRQWISAYHRNFGLIAMRFFIGDAVAFAYTLQHMQPTLRITAHWYRDQYSLKPLVLDGYDSARGAPLTFDVIDTSNLSDHLGSLVLLTATTPLLRYKSSSALFTEFHLKRSKTYQDGLDSMLGGHVPTLSTLLGLFPAEYWTGISSVSLGDEQTLNEKSVLCMVPTSGPYPKLTKVQFDSNELAEVLYQIYAKMLPVKEKDDERSLETPWHYSRRSCHHFGFALFLRLVQTRFNRSWDAKRRNNQVVEDYTQEELYTYFHIMGLLSTDIIKEWSCRNNLATLPASLTPRERWGDLRDSDNMPPVVCMILQIPREKLAELAKLNRIAAGTTVVHCIIQSIRMNSQQNMFPACQLAFGHISTSRNGYDQSFEISVTEDHACWKGKSPIIAAFYIPASLAMTGIAELLLGIHSGSGTVATSDPVHSAGMNIPKTTLSNVGAVYITRYAPNQTGFPVATGFIPDLPVTDIMSTRVVSSLVPGVNSETGEIVTFTGRLDVTCNYRKQAIKSGRVDMVVLSPCELSIKLRQTKPLVLSFPVFFLGDPIPVFDRKSFKIELTAKVANTSDWSEWYRYMYPIHLREGSPINWSLPYINLDKCLEIDLDQTKKLRWLFTHLLSSLTARERDMEKEKSETTLAKQSYNEQWPLLRFKRSILNLFTSPYLPSNKGNRKTLMVTIKCHSQKGDYFLFIIPRKTCINLADRTVVLECAISTSIFVIKEFISFAPGYFNIASITVDDAQLQLWRQILPAWVERCRCWKHREGCEYKRYEKIPLDSGKFQRLLCRCGNGIFSTDSYRDIHEWPLLKPLFVQAAISPVFVAPFAGDTYLPANSMSSGDSVPVSSI